MFKKIMLIICAAALMLSLCGCRQIAQLREMVAFFETMATEEVETQAVEQTVAPTVMPTEATFPPETEPKPTEPAPTQPKPTTPKVDNTPATPAWKNAYLAVLERNKDYCPAFALVQVDSDGIPELYITGSCEADGDAVYSYKNGAVLEQRLRRTWGGKFIPKTGLMVNTNGNMGFYSTDIYRLTASGFDYLWSGQEFQSFEDGYESNVEYYIADRPVSEEEYFATIATYMDLSQAVSFHEYAVAYEEIRQQIIAY